MKHRFANKNISKDFSIMRFDKREVLPYELRRIQKAVELLPGFTIGEVDVFDSTIKSGTKEYEIAYEKECERAIDSANETLDFFYQLFHKLDDKYFESCSPFDISSFANSFVINNVYVEKGGYACVTFYSLEDVLDNVISCLMEENDDLNISHEEATEKYLDKAVEKIESFALELTHSLCPGYDNGELIDGEFLYIIHPYADGGTQLYFSNRKFALQPHELPRGFVGEVSDKYATVPKSKKKSNRFPVLTFSENTNIHERFVNILKSNVDGNGKLEFQRQDFVDEDPIRSEILIRGKGDVTDYLKITIKEQSVDAVIVDKSGKETRDESVSQYIQGILGNVLNDFSSKMVKYNNSKTKNFSDMSLKEKQKIVQEEMEASLRAELDAQEEVMHEEMRTWDRSDEVRMAQGIESWMIMLGGTLMMFFIGDPTALFILGGTLLLGHMGVLAPVIYGLFRSIKRGWQKLKAGVKWVFDAITFQNKDKKTAF